MKQSNVKAADLHEMLNRAGSTISDTARNAGGAISKWYGGLDPTVRNSILGGLGGAGLGALATGGLAAMGPEDDEHGGHRHILSNALLGAVLGGTAGAAIPAGIGMLRGQFPNEEEHRGPLGATLNAATPSMGNIGAYAGGIYGAHHILKDPEGINALYTRSYIPSGKDSGGTSGKPVAASPGDHFLPGGERAEGSRQNPDYVGVHEGLLTRLKKHIFNDATGGANSNVLAEGAQTPGVRGTAKAIAQQFRPIDEDVSKMTTEGLADVAKRNTLQKVLATARGVGHGAAAVGKAPITGFGKVWQEAAAKNKLPGEAGRRAALLKLLLAVPGGIAAGHVADNIIGGDMRS